MPSSAVTFAESALGDLEEASDRYAEQGVPEVGNRLVAEVFNRVEALADHPEMGPVVPEFGQSFLRELIHPPFRIVHRYESGRVRVVRVWRSERLLQLSEGDNQKGPG